MVQGARNSLRSRDESGTISGAMGAMLPADPGNYTADFGSFGKIDFVVKKPE